jgi:hypothetical protein
MEGVSRLSRKDERDFFKCQPAKSANRHHDLGRARIWRAVKEKAFGTLGAIFLYHFSKIIWAAILNLGATFLPF